MKEKKDLQCKYENCTNRKIDYNEKNTNSNLLFLDIFEDKKTLEDYVIEQIQYYSRTGERLYQQEDITKALKFRMADFKPKVMNIIRSIFYTKKEDIIQTIYDMTFGKVRFAIQKLRHWASQNGMEVLTTSQEWFDMVLNRDEYLKTGPKKTTEFLKVLIKCAQGHIYVKYAREISKGCKHCQPYRVGIAYTRTLEEYYEYIKDVCSVRGYELITTKKEIILKLKKSRQIKDRTSFEGRDENVGIEVRHKGCNHEFKIRFKAVLYNPGCKFCISHKKQKIVQLIIEEMLGEKFEPEVQIHRVFNKVKHKEVNDFDFRVKLDMFKKVGIRDKNGNFIKLAIERHGQQHEPTLKGFKIYLKIAKHPDIKRGSKIYKTLWKKWMKQLNTDKKEIEIFQKYNENGYYLIVVHHKIKNHQVEQFIINELMRQTGNKISYIGIQWQTLFNKIK